MPQDVIGGSPERFGYEWKKYHDIFAGL